MIPATLYGRFVEPAPRANANESALDPGHSDFRTLRTKRLPNIPLALRPARSSDGDALQTYVRGLSPQSRYNRFLGGAHELPASELARALASGRDTLTLLLISTVEDRQTVVGEARMALSCAERAGEFSMSIADDLQHVGVGSALLREIERKAAADGIELLFGDTLWTNKAMIGLARASGFRLGPSFEARLVRVQKRLDAAPDLPCRKWKEIADGAAVSTA
jgi:GNAT superfamily N-acetyltransferase